MLHAKIVNIKKSKIKISKAENFISSSKFGASLYFLGTVRNINNKKKVTGIKYDVHKALVIKSFKKIYKEAEKKLKIKNKAVFIEHVKGYVRLGQITIIIAVACKHRNEAYKLSRYVIEQIKKKSPIWKKEYYSNKKIQWLKGKSIKI